MGCSASCLPGRDTSFLRAGGEAGLPLQTLLFLIHIASVIWECGGKTGMSGYMGVQPVCARASMCMRVCVRFHWPSFPMSSMALTQGSSTSSSSSSASSSYTTGPLSTTTVAEGPGGAAGGRARAAWRDRQSGRVWEGYLATPQLTPPTPPIHPCTNLPDPSPLHL